MTFTESNTVEALVRDILCGGVTHHTALRTEVVPTEAGEGSP